MMQLYTIVRQQGGAIGSDSRAAAASTSNGRLERVVEEEEDVAKTHGLLDGNVDACFLCIAPAEA